MRVAICFSAFITGVFCLIGLDIAIVYAIGTYLHSPLWFLLLVPVGFLSVLTTILWMDQTLEWSE